MNGFEVTDVPAAVRAAPARGGDVVVRALEALGATAAFGVPGTHALAIWEALRESPVATLAMRTELCAGFAPIVKRAWRAESAAALPELLAEAWRTALAPPSGPVYVEVPVDVLDEPADPAPPAPLDPAPPPTPLPAAELLSAAADLLTAAERPVLWAGGGVERSGASEELRELAERLRAPVATTYMGKGGFPADHPLAAGSACDDVAFQELLSEADVVLCVGTELGAETTFQYRLRISGRLVQIDAAPERIGSTYPALALVGDAAAVLAPLLPLVGERPADGRAEQRVEALR